MIDLAVRNTHFPPFWKHRSYFGIGCASNSVFCLRNENQHTIFFYDKNKRRQIWTSDGSMMFNVLLTSPFTVSNIEYWSRLGAILTGLSIVVLTSWINTLVEPGKSVNISVYRRKTSMDALLLTLLEISVKVNVEIRLTHWRAKKKPICCLSSMVSAVTTEKRFTSQLRSTFCFKRLMWNVLHAILFIYDNLVSNSVKLLANDKWSHPLQKQVVAICWQ